MQTIIFNDHSTYHSGCNAVIDVLNADLLYNDHDVVASVDRICDPQLFNSSELVIVNGEGTMHSNRIEPHELLEILCVAKESGKKTALINCVWQDMTLSDRTIDVLSDTYISVRDQLSADYMAESTGIYPHTHLDLSYYARVSHGAQTDCELLCGKSFPPQQDYRPQDCATLDIFSDSWDTCVSKLRHADWCITGRHHELYAGCVAQTPVSVISGNTWKNEGLFATAGVEIPVAHKDISHADIPHFISMCKERSQEYEKLWAWMESQTPWSSSLLEEL